MSKEHVNNKRPLLQTAACEATIKIRPLEVGLLMTVMYNVADHFELNHCELQRQNKRPVSSVLPLTELTSPSIHPVTGCRPEVDGLLHYPVLSSGNPYRHRKATTLQVFNT